MGYGGSLLLPLQIFTPDPYKDYGPLSVDERFSTIITNIFPEFVESDYPKFVSFMKAYFEYLEIFGNPRAEAVRLGSYSDIDETLEDFISYFKSTYLNNFPEQLASGVVDEHLIKRITDYYGEKGNKRSLDFLFRILFNVETIVRYPKDDLFKLSDADYSPSSTIRISRYNTIDEILPFKGGEVTQREFDNFDSPIVANGFIDDITFHRDDGVDFCDLKVVKIRGSFKGDHFIELRSDNRNRLLIERAFKVLNGLKIFNAGSNYAINDEIVVTDSAGKVAQSSKVVAVSSVGAIEALSTPKTINRIFFPAENYTFAIRSAGGTGASFGINTDSAVIEDTTVFTSDRSRLSSDSFIQDNFKFQNYSYIIQSVKQIKLYADILKKVFHPSGAVMLADFIQNNDFGGSKFEYTAVTFDNFISPRIANFFPYTIGSTTDLRGDTVGFTFSDWYPTGYNGLTGATTENFNGSGLGISHDPYNAGTFVFGPVGGITAGDACPEELLFGVAFEKPGYTLASQPQTVMTETDDAYSKYFIVHKHPVALLTRSLPAADGSSEAEKRANKNPRFSKYIKDHRGLPKVARRLQKLFIDQNSGISGSISTDDKLIQKIPGKPDAIGIVTAVETERSDVTNFYTNKPIAKIITEFRQGITTQPPVDPSGVSGASQIDAASAALLSFASPSVASYVSSVASSPSVSGLEYYSVLNTETGEQEVDIKISSEKSTQSAVRQDPNSGYQREVKNSEVIAGGNLKATTVTVRIVSGEFSNETDTFGNKYQVKTSDGAKVFKLASGLAGKDISVGKDFADVKGTASSDDFLVASGEFGEVEIGAFITALEAE